MTYNAESFNKINVYNSLIPQTRVFLERLYGSFEGYLDAKHDPKQNKFLLMEEACLLYDKSILNEECAKRGLELLDTPESDTYLPLALYNRINQILSDKILLDQYTINYDYENMKI